MILLCVLAKKVHPKNLKNSGKLLYVALLANKTDKKLEDIDARHHCIETAVKYGQFSKNF